MPAKELSDSQKLDAARLKTRFNDWKLARKDQGLPASQEDAAASLGFGQSALSQYLRGDIPLNPAAADKFARLIGCSVADFSPDIAIELLKTWPFPSIERERFDRLSAGQKIEIQGAVRKMIIDFENVSQLPLAQVNTRVGRSGLSGGAQKRVQTTPQDLKSLRETKKDVPINRIPGEDEAGSSSDKKA